MTPRSRSDAPPLDPQVHELHRHPISPTGSDVAVTASVQCPAQLQSEPVPNWLSLRFVLQGQIRTLRIPPQAPAEACDGLWQHTCAELFVRTAGGAAYQEFNFSPSGQWAAYRFSSERQRDTEAETRHPACAPLIEVQATGDTLTMHIRLPIQNLSPNTGTETLRLGLNMVTEHADGSLAYWALQHPRLDRPDFHHRDGCILPMRWPASVTP